jgi:hypothetical protein
VPLGFGRVYVHLPDGFSYDAWMQGLNAGRSFVTTGPMLRLQLEGQDPGHRFAEAQANGKYRLAGLAESAVPLDRMEVVINGRVEKILTPQNQATSAGGFVSRIDAEIPLAGSGWIAVRVFEKRPDGRVRFAHSAPWHVEVAGQPLRPRREELEYLCGRMREEIERNRDVLSSAELEEYRDALQAYERLGAAANRAK